MTATYTAKGLIHCMLAADGHVATAMAMLLQETTSLQKLRMETVLDAARGLFEQRDANPNAAAWALRLCDYVCKPNLGFSPIWRAVALKVSFYETLGEIPKAKQCYDELTVLADEQYEAGIVAQRLYQRLCGHDQFWSR